MKHLTSNILKILLLVFICLQFFVVNTQAVDSKTIIYEIKEIGKQKIKISLLDASTKKSANVSVSFYYFKNAKTLVVGYKNSSDKNPLSTITVGTSTALMPIRVILAKTNDKDNLPFNDIKGIEAEEYIRHLHDMGILVGDKNNNFKPFDTISRGEFCSILVKSLKITPKETKTLPFNDISKHWAKAAIIAASQKGFLSDFKEKKFNPDSKLTVAECSVIISKAFKFNTKFNGVFTKLKNGKWYTQGINKLFVAGIISAKDGVYKDFNEERAIKRGEAVTMLSRALSTY